MCGVFTNATPRADSSAAVAVCERGSAAVSMIGCCCFYDGNDPSARGRVLSEDSDVCDLSASCPASV